MLDRLISDWEITGGSGANVSVGTPIAKVSFDAGFANSLDEYQNAV